MGSYAYWLATGLSFIVSVFCSVAEEALLQQLQLERAVQDVSAGSQALDRVDDQIGVIEQRHERGGAQRAQEVRRDAEHRSSERG